jgi:hypothetical protein
MKSLILATAGLVTFAILRRRRPGLTGRVQGAVKDAAERVADEVPSDLADRVRETAKGIVG